jgi:hypothetical protein
MITSDHELRQRVARALWDDDTPAQVTAVLAALGLDDLDAFIRTVTTVIADGQLVGSEPAEAWQPLVSTAIWAALTNGTKTAA